MDPFKRPSSCKKCGSVDFKKIYCPKKTWHADGVVAYTDPEHIMWTCINCGWTWNTKMWRKTTL